MREMHTNTHAQSACCLSARSTGPTRHGGGQCVVGAWQARVERSTDVVDNGLRCVRNHAGLDADRPSAITAELLATITQLCHQAVGWSVTTLALCASNKRGG